MSSSKLQKQERQQRLMAEAQRSRVDAMTGMLTIELRRSMLKSLPTLGLLCTKWSWEGHKRVVRLCSRQPRRKQHCQGHLYFTAPASLRVLWPQGPQVLQTAFHKECHKGDESCYWLLRPVLTFVDVVACVGNHCSTQTGAHVLACSGYPCISKQSCCR